MKMILTGGAGFIGSCYLWKLNSLGIDRITVVDSEPDPSVYPTLRNKKVHDYIERTALLRRIKNDELIEHDLVVHLGACSDTTETDAAYLASNNTEFSRELAQWALRNGKRFHYASSASVYGDGQKGFSDEPARFGQYKPLNPYAESKYRFDQWVYENKLDKQFVGFRYFNVFGPNESHKGNMRSLVSKAFDQIREFGSVRLFASTRAGYEDGSEERDFVYVKDVCNVMAWFLDHPEKGGIFNVGTGKARTFKDLATAVFSALRKPVKIDFIPMPEKLRGRYQYVTQADLRRLRASGNDTPFRPLEESVQDTVRAHLTHADPYL